MNKRQVKKAIKKFYQGKQLTHNERNKAFSLYFRRLSKDHFRNVHLLMKNQKAKYIGYIREPSNYLLPSGDKIIPIVFPIFSELAKKKIKRVGNSEK